MSPPIFVDRVWSDLNFMLFQWEVMPDLFFYRDPEEVEREEAAKEAEVVAVMYYQYEIWK